MAEEHKLWDKEEQRARKYVGSAALQKPVGVIDTHCHIDILFMNTKFRKSFSEFQQMNYTSFPEQYEGCVTVFCNPESFGQVSLWKNILREKGVYGAFGCHPRMAFNYTDQAEEALTKALQDPSVVALGEIGLDYSKRNFCSPATQKTIFRRQLFLALDRNLPLVIHCREAHEDCFDIMREIVPRKHKIHLHCFTDEWAKARQWIHTFDNLFVGFTNKLSYPSSAGIRETVLQLPLHRILLETDAPYFVPRCMPKSLRSSHPGMVIHVAEEVARIKNLSLSEVLSTCRQNTAIMYSI